MVYLYIIELLYEKRSFSNILLHYWNLVILSSRYKQRDAAGQHTGLVLGARPVRLHGHADAGRQYGGGVPAESL